ncbi:hypothetical protein [Sinosporangium siamense]|uniref:Uncharacterized protein n=1 Tax=Sinosporangium siamense TaxID=1367973 RepID=A0A919RPB7_9ACTN|nr:hypothetical protein [Sinosporangium siamense]GII96164.1 hypothetical protein Ssi02_63950 [Sinosporangium siamense]
MAVSRRALIAALVATATLSLAPPAGAAESASAARAAVTDIREVINLLPYQVQFFKREDQSTFTVMANSRWTGSMWIPWAASETEMEDKHIIIYWSNGRLRLFQDYRDPSDQVKYSQMIVYHAAIPVPGASTGGGRKRVTVNPDGSLSMENIG